MGAEAGLEPAQFLVMGQVSCRCSTLHYLSTENIHEVSQGDIQRKREREE